jgi:hypothetical protein
LPSRRWRSDDAVLDLFRVARKFAGCFGGSMTVAWLRAGLAAALWGASVSLAQVAAGPSIGRETRGLEERIELRLREPCGPPPEPESRPPGADDAAFEPWELVGV